MGSCLILIMLWRSKMGSGLRLRPVSTDLIAFIPMNKQWKYYKHGLLLEIHIILESSEIWLVVPTLVCTPQNPIWKIDLFVEAASTNIHFSSDRVKEKITLRSPSQNADSTLHRYPLSYFDFWDTLWNLAMGLCRSCWKLRQNYHKWSRL